MLFLRAFLVVTLVAVVVGAANGHAEYAQVGAKLQTPDMLPGKSPSIPLCWAGLL